MGARARKERVRATTRVTAGAERHAAGSRAPRLADPFDRRGCHAGDSLATADEAHPFVGPELHTDLAAVEAGRRGGLPGRAGGGWAPARRARQSRRSARGDSRTPLGA